MLCFIEQTIPVLVDPCGQLFAGVAAQTRPFMLVPLGHDKITSAVQKPANSLVPEGHCIVAVALHLPKAATNPEGHDSVGTQILGTQILGVQTSIPNSVTQSPPVHSPPVQLSPFVVSRSQKPVTLLKRDPLGQVLVGSPVQFTPLSDVPEGHDLFGNISQLPVKELYLVPAYLLQSVFGVVSQFPSTML